MYGNVSFYEIFYIPVHPCEGTGTCLQRVTSRVVLHQFAVVSVINFSVVFSPERNHVGRAKRTWDRQTDEIFRDEPCGASKTNFIDATRHDTSKRKTIAEVQQHIKFHFYGTLKYLVFPAFTKEREITAAFCNLSSASASSISNRNVYFLPAPRGRPHLFPQPIDD